MADFEATHFDLLEKTDKVKKDRNGQNIEILCFVEKSRNSTKTSF